MKNLYYYTSVPMLAWPVLYNHYCMFIYNESDRFLPSGSVVHDLGCTIIAGKFCEGFKFGKLVNLGQTPCKSANQCKSEDIQLMYTDLPPGR